MPGKESALREIRLNLIILLFCGPGGVLSIVRGLFALPAKSAWIEIGSGIAMVVLAAGIWNAKEWARWVGGLLTSALALVCLVRIVGALRASDNLLPLAGVLVAAGLMGILAWYLFLPSTRRRFAEAREQLARRGGKGLDEPA